MKISGGQDINVFTCKMTAECVSLSTVSSSISKCPVLMYSMIFATSS